MNRRWIRVSLGLCLAACGGDGGDDFIVPGYSALMAKPAATSCTEEDYESDGVIDERTLLVEEDAGRTWRYEVRDVVGELTSHALYHFDSGGRLLDTQDTFVGYPTSRCYWVYDSFGRELRSDCDYDGDGVFEDYQRTTAWSDAGEVTMATLRNLGRDFVVTRTYDELGRLLTEENRAVDDGTVSWSYSVVYDDAARTRTVIFSVSGTVEGSRRQVTHFDARGRRLRMESTPLGGNPNAQAWTKDFIWDGDELLRTVQVWASGQKWLTVYSQRCDG